MADSDAQKANLINAVERDCFAAFTLNKHLRDPIAIPDNLHLELVLICLS